MLFQEAQSPKLGSSHLVSKLWVGLVKPCAKCKNAPPHALNQQRFCALCHAMGHCTIPYAGQGGGVGASDG